MMSNLSNFGQEKIISSLKITKFVGVFFMVINHTLFWLILAQGLKFKNSFLFLVPYLNKMNFIGFFNMLLPIAAGAMLRFRFNGYIANNRLKYSLKNTIKLVIFLFVLGIFYNIFVWGWSDFDDWDLLFFISFSFLLIALISKINLNLLYLISLPLLFLTRFFQSINFPNNYFFQTIIGGNALQGIYWPILPWFPTVVYGFFIFDFLYSSQKLIIKKMFLIGNIFLNFLFSLAYGGNFSFKINPENFWQPIFNPNISVVFFILAIFSSIVFAGLSFKTKWLKYGLVNSFSQGILWIYIFQSFLSNRLSFFFTKFAPRSLPYFWIYLGFLILFYLSISWIIGYTTIKIQEKRITINLLKR